MVFLLRLMSDHRQADKLAGRSVIIFIDNLAIACALIAGRSSEQDLQYGITAFHCFMSSIRCQWWIEWIDSKANPADEPSRTLGHTCFPCGDLKFPDWAYPLYPVEQLLKYFGAGTSA